MSSFYKKLKQWYHLGLVIRHINSAMVSRVSLRIRFLAQFVVVVHSFFSFCETYILDSVVDCSSVFGPAFFSFTCCAIFLLPMSLLSLRDKFHVLAFWSSQTTSGLSFSAKSVVESKRISKKKSEYWKLWFTAWNCGSELQRTNYKYYFLRWFFFRRTSPKRRDCSYCTKRHLFSYTFQEGFLLFQPCLHVLSNTWYVFW